MGMCGHRVWHRQASRRRKAGARGLMVGVLLPAAVVVVVALVAAGGCAGAMVRVAGEPEVLRDTPTLPPRTADELVRFVQQAAGHVQRHGTEAFEAFAAGDGPWRYADVHLFVLDPEGEALYYSSAPHLVGRDVAPFTDLEGRPFVHWQLAAAHEPGGTAWAFYKWPRPHDFEPTWTATYVQRVTARDGRRYVVGAGIYAMDVDGTLLRALVARADERLRDNPEAARRAIDDPQGPFAYREARVLVINDASGVEAGPALTAMPPALARWIHEGEADSTTFRLRLPGSAERTDAPAQGGAAVYAKRVDVEGVPRVVVAMWTPQ